MLGEHIIELYLDRKQKNAAADDQRQMHEIMLYISTSTRILRC